MTFSDQNARKCVKCTWNEVNMLSAFMNINSNKSNTRIFQQNCGTNYNNNNVNFLELTILVPSPIDKSRRPHSTWPCISVVIGGLQVCFKGLTPPHSSGDGLFILFRTKASFYLRYYSTLSILAALCTLWSIKAALNWKIKKIILRS